MWKRVVPALIVVVVVGVGIAQRQTKGVPAQAPPGASTEGKGEAAQQTPVSVVAARSETMQEKVEVTGALRAADEAIVTARTAGRVVWVVGKDGTPVRRGQVVARLDDGDLRARVRAARAALEGAQARLAQAKAAAVQQVTATDSGIRNAAAAVEAADANLNQERTSADAQDATLHAQVRAAQAALDAARSQLTILRNGSRTQERSIAEQSVRTAQATYDNDKANYDRTQGLYQTGAVAKLDLDNAETRMRVSRAQLESAKEQLSLVQTGPRQEEIQAAEAAVRQAEQGLAVAQANLKQLDVARARVTIAGTGVRQAQAALDAARSSRHVNVMRDKDVLAAETAVSQAREALTLAVQDLGYAVVTSPVDGVVAQKIAEVGQSFGPDVPLLRLSTTQALYFEASVSELEATRLRAGQPVELVVDALQGVRSNIYADAKAQPIIGTVERVVPVVNDQTRSFNVRVTVPRRPSLMAGMFARGGVVTARHDNAVSVPREVLVEKGGLRQVFVVKDGVAQARPVTTGAVDGTSVQILSGLAAGEQVVSSGQQTLANGDRVKVIAAAQPGATE